MGDALVMYMGEETIFIPCEQTQSTIIKSFIQYSNELPVKDEARKKLEEESEKLNRLLNPYGVFFGIRGDVFIIDTQEVQHNVEGTLLEESGKEEILKQEVVFSTTLWFGSNGEKGKDFKIFTPIKERNAYVIKCILGKQEVNLTGPTLKFFISLIESGESGSSASYQVSNQLNILLSGTIFELIGTKGKKNN